MKTYLLIVFVSISGVNAQETAPRSVQKGDPCNSKEELAAAPGSYFSAAQYPWPAVRAEYFKKMTTAADKTIARQTLELIEKTEQRSRGGFVLAGGSWEGYYSSEGYNYFGSKKLADYRFQAAFHEYLCINKKVNRNNEYSTVLRVYVNGLALNTLNPHLSMAFNDNLGDYAYKDQKNYKAGMTAPKIELMNYLAEKKAGIVEAINSGSDYWQDVPENEIRKNTYSPVYRYWFVKKSNVPLLLPVSRKEYLESLLEYYEKETMALPQSTRYESGSAEQRQRYFGDLSAVLGNKKAVVSQALKENRPDWLSQQAVVNASEDKYQNQKHHLPEYSSDFTFRKFYDKEEKAAPLYKYNPEYFSASQLAASPQFMAIVFRYVGMPAHLRLVKNFTENFNTEAWKTLIEK